MSRAVRISVGDGLNLIIFLFGPSDSNTGNHSTDPPLPDVSSTYTLSPLLERALPCIVTGGKFCPLLNGLQTLWIILDSFEHDDNLVGATLARQITEMKWLGDENKSTLYCVWTQLVDGLRESHLIEKGSRDLLADQMGKVEIA